MNVCIPIDCPDGHQYLLRFEYFENLPMNIDKELGVKVVDISLVSESEIATINNIGTLNLISTAVFNFLDENDVVLYYYCSKDAIYQRKNRKKIPPQQYRSKLFLALFDKIIEKYKRMDYINKPIIIPDISYGDHYIHFIAKSKHSDKLDNLADYMNKEFEK